MGTVTGAPVPLDVRSDVATAWTGSELVVWGGDLEAFNSGLAQPDRAYADGAAYDVATGSWRPMAPSPLPEDTTTPVAATTDAGVVIARGTATALWEPGTDTWRELAPAPTAVTDLVGAGGLAVSVGANAVLDVEAGTWESLPAPPSALQRPTAASTGSELVVVGGPDTPFTGAAGHALDLAERRWRSIAAPPAGLRAEALDAAWDGERVVVVNYDMTAATYDPGADRWDELPAVPARFSEWYPVVRHTSAGTVVVMSQSVVVLGPDDRWTPLPGRWVGDAPTSFHATPADPSGFLFDWGIDTETATNVLTVVDPGTLVDDRRQVGVATLTLPPGARQAGTTFVTEDGGVVERVALDVDRADGTSCTVTSTYVGVAPTGTGLPEQEVVEGPAGPAEWTRSGDATEWQLSLDEASDVVGVACDTEGAARALVPLVHVG